MRKDINAIRKEYKDEKKDSKKFIHVYADLDDYLDFHYRVEKAVGKLEDGYELVEMLNGRLTVATIKKATNSKDTESDELTRFQKRNFKIIQHIRDRVDMVTLGKLIVGQTDAYTIMSTIKSKIIESSMGTADMLRDMIRGYRQEFKGTVMMLGDYIREFELKIQAYQQLNGSALKEVDKFNSLFMDSTMIIISLLNKRSTR